MIGIHDTAPVGLMKVFLLLVLLAYACASLRLQAADAPGRQIRALLLDGQWEKARVLAPAATTPRPEALIAEGKVTFASPVLIPFKAEGQPWPRILPGTWLEFRREAGRLKALLCLRADGSPVARWAVRLEIYDPQAVSGAAPLARAVRKVESSGAAEAYIPFGDADYLVPGACSGGLAFDLGPAPTGDRPLVFRLALDRFYCSAGRSIPFRPASEIPFGLVALGPAEVPRQARTEWIKLDSEGEKLCATVRVSVPAAPRARWRMNLFMRDLRNQPDPQGEKVFENSGATTAPQAGEIHDLAFTFGPWPAPQPSLRCWVTLERLDGSTTATTQSLPRLEGARRMPPTPAPESVSLLATVRDARDRATTQSLMVKLLQRVPLHTPPGLLKYDPNHCYWFDARTGELWAINGYPGRKGSQYSFRNMAPGVYRVITCERGRDGRNLRSGRFGVSDPVRIEPGAAKPCEVTIALSRGEALTVRFIDQKTRRPVPGANAILMRPDGFPVSLTDFPARMSDFEGEVDYDALPPGDYLLDSKYIPETVSYPSPPVEDRPSYRHRFGIPVRVEAGRKNEVEIELEPGRMTEAEIAGRWPFIIEGRVTDANGRPMPGVQIDLDMVQFDSTPGQSFTGPDGRYRLRSSPGMGNQWIWPRGIEPCLTKLMAITKDAQGKMEWSLYQYLILAGAMPAWAPGHNADPGRVVLPGKVYRVDFEMRYGRLTPVVRNENAEASK